MKNMTINCSKGHTALASTKHGYFRRHADDEIIIEDRTLPPKGKLVILCPRCIRQTLMDAHRTKDKMKRRSKYGSKQKAR